MSDDYVEITLWGAGTVKRTKITGDDAATVIDMLKNDGIPIVLDDQNSAHE
ncbi:hypothetical protein [Rhodococcus sp. 5G237]